MSVYVHRNLTLELCAKFGNVGIAVCLDKVFWFFNIRNSWAPVLTGLRARIKGSGGKGNSREDKVV